VDFVELRKKSRGVGRDPLGGRKPKGCMPEDSHAVNSFAKAIVVAELEASKQTAIRRARKDRYGLQ